MKIYTRSGDAGETSLFSGERISKHDPRTEAYGTVDELDAAIGAARAFCRDSEIASALEVIQGWLLVVGAELANPGGEGNAPIRIEDEAVQKLEALIDRADEELEPLTGFILPGGEPAAALLHQARTVCRRAERRITALFGAGKPDPSGTLLRFINRLSDALFTLARLVNRRAGTPDSPWVR